MIEHIEPWSQARQAAGGPPIRVGIGLNNSRVLASTVGTGTRMEYTVIGDGVNLAARVSELTKNDVAPLLMTGATQKMLKLWLQEKFRFFGRQTVRGRTGEVELYGMSWEEVLKIDLRQGVGNENTPAVRSPDA